ncbi:MAG: hypothetical protein P4L53_17045 [Candidatus Obscuribacterales bacterium]|nr:hypothetical protein [Candidatus Obscuribacterales bacterium]
MRFAVTLGSLALLGLGAVWLLAGRQVVLLIDQIATSPAETLPVGRYHYSVTGLTIDGAKMELFDTNEIPVDIRYDINADGRLTLHTQGKAFPLGTRIGPPRTDGLSEFPFAADDGDVVSFIRDHSLLAWPTPFEMNWMTGSSPSWRRNLYYRLRWHKKSGESLALVWRLEEVLFREQGWTLASRLGSTGLIDIAIVGSADGLVESVEHYLRRTKGWVDGDYRLEPAGVSTDGYCDVLRVVHRFDETGLQPGGGLSVELLLDRKTRRIKLERGMQ